MLKACTIGGLNQTKPNYKTTILREGFRYNLERQICEALYTEKMSLDPDIKFLNQRSEQGHHGIPRQEQENLTQ